MSLFLFLLLCFSFQGVFDALVYLLFLFLYTFFLIFLTIRFSFLLSFSRNIHDLSNDTTIHSNILKRGE